MNNLMYFIYYAIAKHMRSELYTQEDYFTYMDCGSNDLTIGDYRTLRESKDIYSLLNAVIEGTYHISKIMEDKEFLLRWRPVMEEVLHIKVGSSKKQIEASLENYSKKQVNYKKKLKTPSQEHMETLINLTLEFQYATKELYTHNDLCFKVTKNKVRMNFRSNHSISEALFWFEEKSEEMKTILAVYNLTNKIKLKTMFNGKSFRDALREENYLGDLYLLPDRISISQKAFPEEKREELENKLTAIFQKKSDRYLILHNELNEQLNAQIN